MRFKPYITIALIFSLSFIKAKANPYIDSLLNAKQTASHDTALFSVLYKLGVAHRDSAYAKSLHYYKEALTIAKKNRMLMLEAEVYHQIGSMMVRKGEFPEALSMHQNALAIFKHLDDKKEIGYVYNDIGLIYRNLGRYNKALDNYLLSLANFSEINFEKGEALVFNNIGQIYYYQENYPKAIENFQQYLLVNQKLKNFRAVAGASNNIASAYMELGNYGKAFDSFKKGMHLYDSLGIQLGVAILSDNIGSLLAKQNRFEEALDYHFTALNIYQEINSIPRMGYAFNNIGYAFYQLNNLESSVEYLNRGKEVAEKLKQREVLKDLYFNLSNTHESSNNFNDALRYYKLYVVLKDSLLNAETSEKLETLEMRYEADKKSRELLIMQNKLSQQKAFGVLIGSAGVVFLVVIGLMYKDRTSKARTLSIVQNQNSSMNEMFKYLSHEPYTVSLNNQSSPIFDIHTIPSNLSSIPKMGFQVIANEAYKAVFTIALSDESIPILHAKTFIAKELLEILSKQNDNSAESLYHVIHQVFKKIESVYLKGVSASFNLLLIDKKNDNLEYYGDNMAWFFDGKEVKTLSSLEIKFSQLDNNSFIYMISLMPTKGNEISLLDIQFLVEKTLQKSHENSLEKQKDILESTIECWAASSHSENDILLLALRTPKTSS